MIVTALGAEAEQAARTRLREIDVAVEDAARHAFWTGP